MAFPIEELLKRPEKRAPTRNVANKIDEASDCTVVVKTATGLSSITVMPNGQRIIKHMMDG